MSAAKAALFALALAMALSVGLTALSLHRAPPPRYTDSPAAANSLS